jgi:thioredoxin reductase
MENKEQKIQKVPILIIGAGPAGCQMGYFLERAKADYLILEKGDKACQFFRTFPRHRHLISINKVHNECEEILKLRYDWNSLISDEMKPNFTDYTDEYFPKAQLLAEYIHDFAEYHKLKIQYNTSVEHVSKDQDGMFYVRIKGSETTYVTKILITASGFGEPFKPEINGIEHALDYYDAPIDEDFYKKKKIIILGKGNSAFEFAKGLFNSADTIYLTSPSPLREATETHYVGSVRAINNLSYEAYQLKSKNFVINSGVRKIEVNKNDPTKFSVFFTYEKSGNVEEDIIVDHVINATGFKMTTSFYDETIKPKMRHCTKLPVLDHTFQSVNVPNLYFIGCLMHGCDYRRGTSGFVHGFRHNIKFLYKLILEKHFSAKYEYKTIKNYEELVTEFINQSSLSQELFLQIKTLCDMAIIKKNGDIKYYHGIFRDYALHNDFTKDEGDLVITLFLNYGKFYQKTSMHPRPINSDEAYTSPYLHPHYDFYRYSNQTLNHISRFEIMEEFDNNWRFPERADRMRREFFAAFKKIEDSNTQDSTVTYEFDIDIDEEMVDNERLLNCIIGPYKGINLKKGKNMNYMKYMPFEHFEDRLVFTESKFNGGYTYDCKSKINNSEIWSMRINHACINEGLVRIEAWPHGGTEISLLPLTWEFKFPDTTNMKCTSKCGQIKEIEPSKMINKVNCKLIYSKDIDTNILREVKNLFKQCKPLFLA